MTDLSPLSPQPAAQRNQHSVSKPSPKAETRDPVLMEAAQQLEATFLSEMLKAAGLGETRKAFGGGAGEDQFSSFLRQAQAEEMVKAGGIGIAESLYQALKEKNDDF